MRKFCITFVFALALCVVSCFALSPDDSIGILPDSAPADTVGSHLLAAVSSAATSSGWNNTDRDYLNQIRLTLTQSNNGSIFGIIGSLLNNSDNIYNKLYAIKQSTDYLQNINNNGNTVVSLLRSNLKGSDILNLLNNAHLDNLAKDSTLRDALLYPDGYPRLANISDVFTWLSNHLSFWLGRDTIDTEVSSTPTLYHYVKNLSDTLASDDDKALADSQKPNRQQIEQDFVSGSSGKTSLGASDFGDLSSVGGSVKDSISLNGQSSISGFTGGLSDSDKAGLGWFSADTRDALDTVSPSSSSSSSYSRRSPDDTYNMAGFAEHYSWLYGG
ncbi:hypothetical protein [Inovirus sp.]|nr:hypothetical protein [Inovirus sp.]